MIGMLAIATISIGNLALGFVTATICGHGPAWAEKRLPARLRPATTPMVDEPLPHAHASESH